MTDLHTDETLFEFPCTFPLKVMGKNLPEFEAAVLAIVRQHVPDLSEGAVTTRPSSGDKWLSLTVTINAQSKAQLDAIYLALNASEHVVMTL